MNIFRLKQLVLAAATISFATCHLAYGQEFQAEDYDYYDDNTVENLGGAGTRNDSVDIERTSDIGGGYNVGWFERHEWLSFKNLSITSPGTYIISARVASPNGGSMILELDSGTIPLGTLDVPATGDWQNWETATHEVTLQPGTYSFGVKVDISGWNFNWIKVEKKGGGEENRPIGLIEAETYDAYADNTLGNEGGAGSRNDDVDIENSTEGNVDIGWWEPGEWLRYDKLYFPDSATYKFSARVASGANGGSLSFELDGSPIGNIGVPATGDWQNWETVEFTANVNSGTHSLKALANTDGFNLNSITIVKAGDPELPCTGNVDPRLCVDAAKGEWTLMTIPDTQHYSQNQAKAPLAHMRDAFDWIVNVKDQLNIEFVQGLGDIVEWGDVASEWDNSTSAWYKLRGQMPHMPIQGNHDNRGSLNHYFPRSSFNQEYWYGEDSGGIENNYALMTIGGEDYMFLQIETYDQYTTRDGNARPEVGLKWGKEILNRFPDRKVLLATHDILGTSTVKNALLTQFDNIVMANAGHMCVPPQHTTTTGPHGGVSHNFVTDFQCDDYEVMFLRYYKFKPQENKVEFYTYSPITGQFKVGGNEQGSFPLVQAE